MKKSPLPPVIYEDDALIAFNKPGGLRVIPDRWDPRQPSLMPLVHKHLSPDWFNVHRLDAETSGILLCAKTRPALVALARSFESRAVGKRYLALVRGVPEQEEITVDLPLRWAEAPPYRMRIDKTRGKPSSTIVNVVEQWRGYALVEARPLTGRTHQIRVHLAAIRLPIVADSLYGNGQPLLLSSLKRGYKFKDEPERPLMGRVALHAESLTFPHPVTRATITIRALLPKDFDISLKYLRRFAGIAGLPEGIRMPEVNQ